jgi:hypothetical protein
VSFLRWLTSIPDDVLPPEERRMVQRWRTYGPYLLAWDDAMMPPYLRAWSEAMSP